MSIMLIHMTSASCSNYALLAKNACIMAVKLAAKRDTYMVFQANITTSVAQ